MGTIDGLWRNIVSRFLQGSALAGADQGFSVPIDAGIPMLASGFAAAVGLIFAICPTWRASSLCPIQASRYG